MGYAEHLKPLLWKWKGFFAILRNMKVSFNAVLIGVHDILKSKIFYENVLDVTFDEARPPFSNFYLNGIEFMVEENTSERDQNWEEDYLGTPKGFCFSCEDINLFLEKVTTFGGTVITEPIKKPWGSIEAKFADLDGNTFIIEQEL